jgi:peptidoglycan/xylan/chitin deacetylase (PgdA/CDA1 family)
VLTPPPSTPARTGRMLAGLLALPLSSLPFFAYTSMTPEGRLVRDQLLVAVAPPKLPKLSPKATARAEAMAPRYDNAVMALTYHGLGSGKSGEGDFSLSPKRFGEHLATLRAAGMTTVTAAEVEQAFSGGRTLPANAVMITFDDGRTDAMMFADPLLEQARMKATMFVITDAAANPGLYYASWKKLMDYSASGRWDLQSHTSGSHYEHEAKGGEQLPSLTSLGRNETLDQYRARVRDDLAKASAAIVEHTGQRPMTFAYPFGAYGAERTNDPAIREILREEVARLYNLAFHQDGQDEIPLVTPRDADRLGLRRLEVENWSGQQLLQHISDSAQRSGFAAPVPPPDGLLDDAGPLELVEERTDPTLLPSSGGEPGVGPLQGVGPVTQLGGLPSLAIGPTAAPRVPVEGVAAAASSAATPVTASPPSRPPIPTTTTGAPTITSPPATAPPATSTPTTRPPSTTTPTTRPPSTTPTTKPPTTTTTLHCPATGKPKPGCPPRGGS